MSTGKLKKTGNSSLWSKYTSLRNEVVNLIKQSKKDQLRKVAKQGTKQFWKTVKFLNKMSSQIPTLKKGSAEF